MDIRSLRLIGKDPTAIAFHKSGTVKFLRSDAYCNLNDIAKPFGKRVQNWMRLKSTQDLIETFEADPVYFGKQAVIAFKGSVSDGSDLSDRLKRLGITDFGNGGTFAHPDIAIQFAQWCSPGFALWVSRQIRHLLTYGEVNLHYTEWSEDQHDYGKLLNREDSSEISDSLRFLLGKDYSSTYGDDDPMERIRRKLK